MTTRFTHYWSKHQGFRDLDALTEAKGLEWRGSYGDTSSRVAVSSGDWHYKDDSPIPPMQQYDRGERRQRQDALGRFYRAKDEIYGRHQVDLNTVQAHMMTRDDEFMARFVLVKEALNLLTIFPDWEAMADLAIMNAEASGERYQVLLAQSNPVS